MYQPAHFIESRNDVLHAFITQHPLGTLITLNTNGELQANPIPFVIDAAPNGIGVLRGHVARANPVWRETRAEVPALVVFQGPQAYISPSWYPSKTANAKVVPTWNYVVVQARGMLRAIDDRDWLRPFVERLTDRFESPRAQPWKVGDAPDDYIETMLRAIVGLEIDLTSLVGKWKASQNRPAADREGVIAGLQEWAGSSGDAQAQAMADTVMDRHLMLPKTKTED
jgi:transcriptional regulator